VCPVRVDEHTMRVPTLILGRSMTTASQAGCTRGGPGYRNPAAIAADGLSAEEVEIPVGLLDELIGLVFLPDR